MIPVQIRLMLRRDVPEVLDIERVSFEVPWTEGDFARCLRQRNAIGLVAEHRETVAGFMLYEFHRNRLDVLRLAVRWDVQRQRVGEQMIQKLVSKLDPERRSKILLEVRESNLSGQLFFRSMGFRAIRVRRDAYPDTAEDAFLFEYRHRASEAARDLQMTVGGS
jgi:ribosomal-protein-alanine N-acetyltransferase